VTSALSLEQPRTRARGARDAVAHARLLGQTALFSRVERLAFSPDTVAFLTASSAALGSGTLWEQAGAGLAFAGAGSAWEMRATGPGRFGQVAAAMLELESRLVRDDDASFPSLGGFAFGEQSDGSHLWSDFPGARLVVPQVLIQNDGRDALLRVTIPVQPRSAPADVEEQMCELFARARHWSVAPLSVDANKTGGD
jgi:menaquinone-specific isochorismate synthase